MSDEADDPEVSVQVGFTYTTGSAPQSYGKRAVHAITPDRDEERGGATIRITGHGFEPDTSVTLGDAAATDVFVGPGGDVITCKTPPHPAGKVALVLTFPDQTTDALPDAFEYHAAGAPPPRDRPFFTPPSVGPLWRHALQTSPLLTEVQKARHLLLNELVGSFSIQGAVGEVKVAIGAGVSNYAWFRQEGAASPAQVQLADEKDEFVRGGRVVNAAHVATVKRSQLDALVKAWGGIDRRDGLPGLSLSELEFSYYTFFDEVLSVTTRLSPIAANVALGLEEDMARIRDSITFSRSTIGPRANEVVFESFKQTSARLENVPLLLKALAQSTMPFPDAQGTVAPRRVVKLLFELLLEPEELPAHPTKPDPHHLARRRLVAADWSALYRAQRAKDRAGAARTLVRDVESATLERSVLKYLMNHMDLTVGQGILHTLLVEHWKKAPAELAKDLRNHLDRYLIVGNYWSQGLDGDPAASNTHQAVLSAAVAAMFKSAFRASPVSLLRKLGTALGWPHVGWQVAALVAAFGVGHCSEHARVAFWVLNLIRLSHERNGTQGPVDGVVFAGWANRDHAFALFNVPVKRLFRTRTDLDPGVNQNPLLEQKGREHIFAFDLKESLDAAPDKARSFVVDAYYDDVTETGGDPPRAELLLGVLGRKHEVTVSGQDVTVGGTTVLMYVVDDRLMRTVDAAPKGKKVDEWTHMQTTYPLSLDLTAKTPAAKAQRAQLTPNV